MRKYGMFLNGVHSVCRFARMAWYGAHMAWYGAHMAWNGAHMTWNGALSLQRVNTGKHEKPLNELNLNHFK